MTKAEATKYGEEMIAKLGKGWTLRVHENLGWWASAHSSTNHLYVSVDLYSPLGKPTYTCLMTDDPVGSSNTGNAIWSDNTVGFFYDPVDAVKYQVALARHVVDRLNAAVVIAEKTVADFV